jgi:UDP-N-acetylglucosamine--N-acetylmuramyl-(pentapeptide) pyrophosphoryl-undecaprenol N-acetylglucosamine transferase
LSAWIFQIDMKNLRFIIAAGGTGGHIFPALAIGEELRARDPGCDILFVGTNRGLEKKVIPVNGFKLKTITMSGILRGFAPADILKNLLAPFRIMIGVMQSVWIVIRFRPNAVIGCGGYVTGPIVIIARILGKRTVLQEQNSRPGRTTIWLSRWVDEVHLTYPEAGSFIAKHNKLIISGNPLRKGLVKIPCDQARTKWNLVSAMPVLLILGGSLGARSINMTILDHYQDIIQNAKAQILWQTGSLDYDAITSRINPAPDRIKIFPFIDDMSSAYSCADLVLCRAGAMTLSELSWMGLPAILVPYPYAADNHQEYNARSLVQRQAAVMILNNELKDKLKPVLMDLLLQPEKLKTMSDNCYELRQPNAARNIVDGVLRLTGRNKE